VPTRLETCPNAARSDLAFCLTCDRREPRGRRGVPGHAESAGTAAAATWPGGEQGWRGRRARSAAWNGRLPPASICGGPPVAGEEHGSGCVRPAIRRTSVPPSPRRPPERR
jgi:hypothetical protein